MRRDGAPPTALQAQIVALRHGAAAALILSLWGIFVLLPAAATAETATHSFDATLSLTGSCDTSEEDPVPDPSCPVTPPSGKFIKHGAVTVDRYGNRYVANAGGALNGSEGRIDVFDSSGQFLTEIKDPVAPSAVAVDSEGNLYVGRSSFSPQVYELVIYAPSKYVPATGEIEYDNPPNSPIFGSGKRAFPVIDPENDHLFVTAGRGVKEYTSKAEGNTFVSTIVADDDASPISVVYSTAIDFARSRVYLALPDYSEGYPPPPGKIANTVVKVFNLEAPHEQVGMIDGSTTATGRFTSEPPLTSVAIEEATGHVFVSDFAGQAKKRVYEFEPDGTLVSTLEHSFKATNSEMTEMTVDNSPTSATQNYLFVPSGVAPGHSYAFKPIPAAAPPRVDGLSASGITDDEAILAGRVNPENVQTDYRLEYVTEQSFKESEFDDAVLVGEGTLIGGDEPIAISARASDLEEGTAYRFRLVASSAEGEEEAQSTFATYASPQVTSDCPNQALRTGLSAALPDCRAYELVTPANTNGHPPYGQTLTGQSFPSRLTSPSGDAVFFQATGGVLPGTEATGGYQGDPYLAKRGADGWHTEGAGTTGSQSSAIEPGSPSADQEFSVWAAGNGTGPASIEGKITVYLRYPDGHSEVLASGSQDTQPNVLLKLVSEGASHAIFVTGQELPRRLEPNAPPQGTKAVYDRTPDRVLHVVSLLPGEVTPAAGQDANFVGASLDGRGVAFAIGTTLYLRRDNAETFEIGQNLTFEGVTEGGNRVFYLKGGNLYAFDAATETRIPFTEEGNVTVANVANGGSAAYFLSTPLTGVGPNPNGAVPQPGNTNLYLSREGEISFVGTVTKTDVEGVQGVNGVIGGLGLWLGTQGQLVDTNWGYYSIDPSRSTPNGDVLLFESRAPLAGYDPEGHTEVYRYDYEGLSLSCLSCNPTGVAATDDAHLQTVDVFNLSYLSHYNAVNNLRADGKRAFFESEEALVLNDTDGLRDVYEWEDEGVGSCQEQGGCVRLVSSGSSGHDDLLFAVSDSGNDVFIRSADLLSAADPDETPSIYDARVGGGFPPPPTQPGECLGEACQPAASAPDDATPASAAFQGAGNVKGTPPATGKGRCRKGKRGVARASQRRCATKRQHKKSQKRRSGAKRGAK